MRIREDGSVQPSSLPTHQNVGRNDDHALYRCMIIKVVYVDDPANISANSTNPRVLYDCVVIGGFASGQVISNCRLSSELGGDFNFYERTLRAASQNVSKTKLSDQDGDIVFVQFVQGHTGFPVIVALDNGITTEDDLGATSSDGQIVHWQYNGVNVKIDKNGNLTLTRKGGSYDSSTQVFTPDPSGQKIKLRMEAQKIVLTLENGLSLVIDGSSDSLTATTKAGTKIALDGAGDSVKVTTKGGAKLTVDGTSGEISAQDNAGGKLKIKDSKVGLGTSSNELVDLMKQMADALATTTAPGFGAPISSVATFGVISGKLGAIKGGV